MTDTTTKKSLDRLAERMERIGEELRVRVHLAGLDAKDSWDRTNLDRIGDELAEIRDELRVQLHLASLDAKDAWNRIEKKIDLLGSTPGVHGDEIVRDVASNLAEVARSFREQLSSRDSAERR
ncbi:hypothetical protein [Sandaracinus amylolyticus]|uniref:Uncharacterized protein n=1 Tax=Sandaracinus amylolyticus TaxID=927083 RepID=A0A0F6W122_9BACT|nr:hypothetical protein [Sandaracinus amylolyticus]AKF04711.1 hypothetical protein DB32_001860 [Sandaracinus amylolyticus]